MKCVTFSMPNYDTTDQVVFRYTDIRWQSSREADNNTKLRRLRLAVSMSSCGDRSRRRRKRQRTKRQGRSVASAGDAMAHPSRTWNIMRQATGRLKMAGRWNVIPLLAIAMLNLASCGSAPPASSDSVSAAVSGTGEYIIGPGDTLNIFVWRNPELSVTIPVRPDGKISTPLVEDITAVGKSPSQLARDMESVLSEYIRSPQVNVIVNARPLGFSTNNNLVLQRARGRYLMLLNDDTIVLDGALDTLVAFMDDNPGAGAAGSTYLNPDLSYQQSFS